MSFRLPVEDLAEVMMSMDEASADSVPSGTATKDDLSWDHWEAVCSTFETDPIRTAQEARDHPDRNALLLSVLMLRAFSIAKPKSKARRFVKPSSALAYPLAIVRIFGRWGVKLANYDALRAQTSVLIQTYHEYHGPLSLCPTQVEPMKFSVIRQIDSVPDGTTVGNTMWVDGDHHVFMFRRLNRVAIFTAFRLGEFCGQRKRSNPGGAAFVKKIHYLTFENISFRYDGVIYLRLTVAQIRLFRPGRDKVLVTPPITKADQSGELHCPFPVYLTYETDHINAAAAILDIEERFGVHLSDEQRRETALFHDPSGQPYEHHFLHGMLRRILSHLYGAATAALFSFHSYRAGLATALHAANVPDDMVQLICRWMCPQSLRRYRVVGLREHEQFVNKAIGTSVDSIQSGNVPKVANNEGFALMLKELVNSNSRHSGQLAKQFETASKTPPPVYPSVAQTPPRVPRSPSVVQPSPPAVRPSSDLRVGDKVIVRAAAWPHETCKEFGGMGWAATVKRVSASACKVFFDVARTRDGRPYEQMVPRVHLLVPE